MSAGAGAGALRGEVRSGRAWLAVFGAIFVCTWGGNQFSPLLLMYEARSHYSSVVVNGLLGIYVLGLIPSLLLSGSLSDRHGRRPVMLVGVAATVTGSVLLAMGDFGLGWLAAGRLCSGIGVGVAMAVGTSWMTELSLPPYELGAADGAGARRSTVVFGAGSAVGAMVAGLFAQWGPLPEVLPFVIHVLVAVPFMVIVTRIPETQLTGGVQSSLLRISGVGHKRFLRVIFISAPWLFASASIGYGYLPTKLLATGSFGLVFATVASIIALATSALIQPFARWVHSYDSARGLIVAVAFISGGLALVTLSIGLQSITLGIASSFLLGAGIGIGGVSGLLEVQRIAGPHDLAGLTGAFYALAYTGFLLPAGIAALAVHVSVLVILWALVGLAVMTGAALALTSRKHLPTP